MKHKKEAFIFLIPGFPKDKHDTNCLPFQQQLIHSIAKTYPNLKLFVLAFQYPYHQKKYTWNDITVIPFGGKNKGGFTRIWLRSKIGSCLEELNRANSITGILSFWLGECAYLGNRFAKKYGLTHYCWIMGQDAKKTNAYPGKMKLSGQELIALSHFLQQEFEKNHGVRPAHVIPPGIAFKPSFNSSHKRSIHLVAVGSLIKLKRFDIFLELVSSLKKEMPGIQAVLIGDGPERENLTRQWTKLDLQNNLSMPGSLPFEKVMEYLQHSKVLLHPSSYEGFSCVCMEAQAAGAHVIRFNNPMNHDMEQWHIAASKEDMLRMARELISDPGTRYECLHSFTMSAAINALMALY